MPATFQPQNWTIFMPKEIVGDSPNTPVSPTNEIATSGQNQGFRARSVAMIGAGALVAKQVINAARNEISATTGNEVLQNQINNMMIGAGLVGVAIAKPGTIPVILAGAVIQSITRQREINRENQAINFNSKLKGKRVSMNGSVYNGY